MNSHPPVSMSSQENLARERYNSTSRCKTDTMTRPQRGHCSCVHTKQGRSQKEEQELVLESFNSIINLMRLRGLETLPLCRCGHVHATSRPSHSKSDCQYVATLLLRDKQTRLFGCLNHKIGEGCRQFRALLITSLHSVQSQGGTYSHSPPWPRPDPQRKVPPLAAAALRHPTLTKGEFALLIDTLSIMLTTLSRR